MSGLLVAIFVDRVFLREGYQSEFVNSWKSPEIVQMLKDAGATE